MPRDLNTYREAGYALEDRAIDAYHSVTGFHPCDKSVRAGVFTSYVAGALYALQMMREGGFDAETATDTLILAAAARGVRFKRNDRDWQSAYPTTPQTNETNTTERNLLG